MGQKFWGNFLWGEGEGRGGAQILSETGRKKQSIVATSFMATLLWLMTSAFIIIIYSICILGLCTVMRGTLQLQRGGFSVSHPLAKLNIKQQDRGWVCSVRAINHGGT